jgi:hypothetical protein
MTRRRIIREIAAFILLIKEIETLKSLYILIKESL